MHTKLCGSPGSVCSVPVCVNAGFVTSGWARHCEPMLRRWSEWLDPWDQWVCPRFGVTFEPRQVLRWAWQEVKGESMSVNSAVYTGVIKYCRADGRQRWCKVDVVAMGRSCSAHTGNEVSSCVGGVAARP